MTWFVKKGEVYLDVFGGPIPPGQPFAVRWCYSPDDATRYRDRETARKDAEKYGARVVVRRLVSFKARAEKAEAEVARLRAALLYISAGKKAGDNLHILGEYASMAMRFIATAQKALRDRPTSAKTGDP